MFLDTQAEITVSDPSGWKGFFVGQRIKAQGVVRVDVGVDLKKMKPEDIVIDQGAKSVSVYFPAAEIMNSSISGDIDIQNKKGVWTNIKDLFNKEEGADYNLAVNELVSQANAAAKSQEGVFDEVNSGAAGFAVFIVGHLLPGYSVQVGQK
jgi:bacillopeptidase F (M6 metalloprotease family)